MDARRLGDHLRVEGRAGGRDQLRGDPRRDPANELDGHGNLLRERGAAGLPPFGLATDQRDRDVAHRRVGLGAVPMALAGLDVHDVADLDLALLVLVGDLAGARGHDEDLVAGMRVPAGRAALAEIDDAAVVIRGLAGLDNRLAGALDRSGPALDTGGGLDPPLRDVFQRDDFQGGPSPVDGSSYLN